MLTATSADGTDVQVVEEGRGPAVLVLHAGLDDGTRWGKVAGLRAPRQIDDLPAIDALGDRRAAYAAIRAPVVLLGGDRSPAHLGARLRAPREVAQVIETHARHVLGQS
ncbi:hypothetical protein [Nonomuraea sp. NPDC049646]|uniref:hypothetical protein n=1 Tax=unclassified Nonomuraea TaxID=2593643 RepID=UPI0037A2CF13